MIFNFKFVRNSPLVFSRFAYETKSRAEFRSIEKCHGMNTVEVIFNFSTLLQADLDITFFKFFNFEWDTSRIRNGISDKFIK